MKRFRPPLQVLRTLREQKEQAAQHAYADAIRRRELAHERLEIARQQLEDAWSHLRLGRPHGAAAQELLRTRHWCDILVEHRQQLEQALQLALQGVDKALRDLTAARRAREIIVRYQDRRFQGHQRELQRTEQKELDEAGTRLSPLLTALSSPWVTNPGKSS
jgi:flagellar export protein FliJ